MNKLVSRSKIENSIIHFGNERTNERTNGNNDDDDDENPRNIMIRAIQLYIYAISNVHLPSFKARVSERERERERKNCVARKNERKLVAMVVSAI